MSPVLKAALQASAPSAQEAQRDLHVPDRAGHLRRDGFCASCGLATALHFGEQNAFTGCVGALTAVRGQHRLLELPVVLTLKDMAKLLDRSQRSIREDVQDGTFPVPHLDQYARYAWHRKDVVRWLGQTTFRPVTRDGDGSQ